MAASEKLYTLKPGYDVPSSIDLGTRLVNGKRGWEEAADASGIAGCAFKKLAEGGEDVEVAMAGMEDLEGKSLEELGDMLRAMPATTDKAFPWLTLLPIILQILKLIGGGGFFGGGSPGPV